MKEGVNEIVAKVRKWCTGSYLEDQDCFRYNGIFRDVYLLSRPEGHIVDIDVVTKGNEVHITLEGSAAISLYDAEKNLVASCEAEGQACADGEGQADGQTCANSEGEAKAGVKCHAVLTVENPVQWNAEKP